MPSLGLQMPSILTLKEQRGVGSLVYRYVIIATRDNACEALGLFVRQRSAGGNAPEYRV